VYDVIVLQIIKICQRFLDNNFRFIILPFNVNVAVIYYIKQGFCKEIELYSK